LFGAGEVGPAGVGAAGHVVACAVEHAAARVLADAVFEAVVACETAWLRLSAARGVAAAGEVLVRGGDVVVADGVADWVGHLCGIRSAWTSGV